MNETWTWICRGCGEEFITHISGFYGVYGFCSWCWVRFDSRVMRLGPTHAEAQPPHFNMTPEQEKSLIEEMKNDGYFNYDYDNDILSEEEIDYLDSEYPPPEDLV